MGSGRGAWVSRIVLPAETCRARRANWYSPSNHDIIIQIDRRARGTSRRDPRHRSHSL